MYMHSVEVCLTSEASHCARCASEERKEEQREKPVLVLLHGYGGGGAVFYRMVKDLASMFHVYLVDLLGMGSSGRPEFPLRQAS